MESLHNNISTRKTRKDYMDKFISNLGGMDAFIKYNREHALRGYHKHKLEHINDPKPEPKKRGRPRTKLPREPKKVGRPCKTTIEGKIETVEDVKVRINEQEKQREIKQALSILFKYI